MIKIAIYALITYLTLLISTYFIATYMEYRDKKKDLKAEKQRKKESK